MVEMFVDASDLLKWARLLRDVPKQNAANIANSVNLIGDSVARSLALEISDRTGERFSVVRQSLNIVPANQRRLLYSMEISGIPIVENTGRQIPIRGWDKGRAETPVGALFKVITSGDDKVCEICQEAITHGPFSKNEIAALAAKHSGHIPDVQGFGERTHLLHPNCRCRLVPFSPTRRLPVSYEQYGPTTAMTVQQIANVVQKAVTATVKTSFTIKVTR